MKPDTARQKLILDMITLAGPVASITIAEALNLDVTAVCCVCRALARTGRLYASEDPDEGRRAPTLWSVIPQPPIERYRKLDATVGIDEDDLKWMAHYRQQAKQRKQQRSIA